MLTFFACQVSAIEGLRESVKELSGSSLSNPGPKMTLNSSNDLPALREPETSTRHVVSISHDAVRIGEEWFNLSESSWSRERCLAFARAVCLLVLDAHESLDPDLYQHLLTPVDDIVSVHCA